MESITISDQYFQEIMRAVGYPFITITDLELTQNQIESLCIIPSMREFYKFFPKTSQVGYSISGTFSIDFPDTETFSVLDARLSKGAPSNSLPTQSPFMNALQYTYAGNSYGGGQWGTRYDYDMTDAYILERALRASNINKNIVFKVDDIDYVNRKLTGYSNISSTLTVTWAKYDTVFANIPYRYLSDVIKLSQAYLLETLASIRGQMRQDLPNEFNADEFMSRATEYRQEIIEKWQNKTKVVILR